MSDPPRIPGLPTHIRLIERLGVGTTSTVWRAWDRAAGLDVAVKVVEDRPGDPAGRRPDRAGRSGARPRAGTIPGILAVLAIGLGEDGTTGWIVTPLVDGRPLDEATAPLSCDEALVLGASASDALAHAHRLGVVHGDLSPSNVFIDAEGAAVLGDFGLATLDGPAGPAGFTPAFAAPERRRGGPPTPAADVYSLGAVLWWATTRGWHRRVRISPRPVTTRRDVTAGRTARCVRRLHSDRPRRPPVGRRGGGTVPAGRIPVATGDRQAESTQVGCRNERTERAPRAPRAS